MKKILLILTELANGVTGSCVMNKADSGGKPNKQGHRHACRVLITDYTK